MSQHSSNLWQIGRSWFIDPWPALQEFSPGVRFRSNSSAKKQISSEPTGACSASDAETVRTAGNSSGLHSLLLRSAWLWIHTFHRLRSIKAFPSSRAASWGGGFLMTSSKTGSSHLASLRLTFVFKARRGRRRPCRPVPPPLSFQCRSSERHRRRLCNNLITTTKIRAGSAEPSGDSS